MLNGQFRVAMETVERMEKSVTDDLFRILSPPMADWMEGFKTYRAHVLVRFGKWDEILELLLMIVNSTASPPLSFTTPVLLLTLSSAESKKPSQSGNPSEKRRSSAHVSNSPTAGKISSTSRRLCSPVSSNTVWVIHPGFRVIARICTLLHHPDYAEPWGWM